MMRLTAARKRKTLALKSEGLNDLIRLNADIIIQPHHPFLYSKMEVSKLNISEKAKRYIKIFVEIGGAASVVVFVVCGQYFEGFVSLIVFIAIAAIMEKYFS